MTVSSSFNNSMISYHGSDTKQINPIFEEKKVHEGTLWNKASRAASFAWDSLKKSYTLCTHPVVGLSIYGLMTYYYADIKHWNTSKYLWNPSNHIKKFEYLNLELKKIAAEMGLPNADRLELHLSTMSQHGMWTASHFWSPNPRIYMGTGMFHSIGEPERRFDILSYGGPALSKEEAKGIFAHEISHILNGHVLEFLGTMVAFYGLGKCITYLMDTFWPVIKGESIDVKTQEIVKEEISVEEKRKRTAVLTLAGIGLCFGMFYSLNSLMLAHEVDADMTAAQYPHYGQGLRDAFIKDFKAFGDYTSTKLFSFAPHPPLSERISYLGKALGIST